MPTATGTASLSSRRSQLAIGRASSQAVLCGAREAKNLAFCDGSTKEFSVNARSAWSPELTKKTVYWASDPEVAQLTWSRMTDIIIIKIINKQPMGSEAQLAGQIY